MLGNEYLDYCNKFNTVWKYIQSCSKDFNTIVSEVCNHRLYFDSLERWSNLFREVGIAFVDESTCDYSKLDKEEFKDLALFSKEGKFLVNERYIIPVRDMLGNVIALIGWYPDSKKYITTPSKFFSKDCLFFGLEQVGDTGLGKDYFLVEGIFDSLHLRSLGYNAIAQMGISSSKVKHLLYGLFRKIVAIPDNDRQGRSVLKNDSWGIPRNASYLKWVGKIQLSEESDKIEIKDIDRLCSLFECEDIKNLLNSCLKHNRRIIKIDI